MLAGLCIWSAVSKYQNGIPKLARKAFNKGEVWNPVCCHVESYAENQTFLVQIGRDISFHHIWYLGCVYDVITANLPILKTWISLKRKEIFENSKQYFSSPLDYLFMFQNGLDRKDAIFVMVPLLKKGTHFCSVVCLLMIVPRWTFLNILPQGKRTLSRPVGLWIDSPDFNV